MTKPLHLTLTDDQDHALHDAVARVRSGSAMVKVDKAALENLLMDFGRALSHLPDGYQTAEGKDGPR